MSTRSAFPINNPISLHESIKSFNLDAVKAGYNFDPESINTIDQINGWTPLYKAIVYEQEKIVQFLLQHGANPNVKNNIGESPLHYVCENSNYKLAQLLLSYGADPDSTQTDGNAALHIACKKNDFKMLKILLSSNCDINLRNNVKLCQFYGCSWFFHTIQSGRTPLHLVAENKNLELFKYLFECGADPNIADKWNRKPHQVTRDRAFYEVVKQVVKEDPNESFYSVLSSNPLGESKSGRSSYCSREGSFIKDPPLDVQRLLKSVNVSISDLAANQIKVKPEQFENVSQSFQKQLKSITKMLNNQESATITEDSNLKKVRKLRINKSVAVSEKLPINRKSNEDSENQNPNTAVATSKDRNHKQSCENSKPVHKHTLTNAILKNLKSPPLVGKQTPVSDYVTHQQNQLDHKPFQMLKNSKQTLSISEAEFRSPLNNIIGGFQSTQASSGNTNPASNDRQTVPKEAKTVQPFIGATKKSPPRKTEIVEGSEAETAGWIGSQDQNASQFYAEMFDGNLSMSVDISRGEVKEERDVIDLLRALHTPKNPYIHAFVPDSKKVSPIIEQTDNSGANLDSQIKQIFSTTLPDNKVSAFQSGADSEDKASEDAKSIELQGSVTFGSLSIRQWLSEIGLEPFASNFTDNGYKSFHEFAQDFSKRAPVDLIYKFGIDKVGHRARIMLKLKEDLGELSRPPLLQCVKEFPGVEEWLKKIGLHQYYQKFADAGFETLEYAIMQVGFQEMPLNERFLKDELDITNEKHRKEIMRHLNHRKTQSLIS